VGAAVLRPYRDGEVNSRLHRRKSEEGFMEQETPDDAEDLAAL